MGVWGSGLYSGDFAADLRAAVTAVARLPFEGDRLLEILIGIEPNAATNQNDEDHTTFWLVVADQFAKRAVACDRVRKTALQIVDDGKDIEMLRSLGMEPALLKKRQSVLSELRTCITAAQSNGEKRVVLKKPQPFLMNVGDVFAYPTSQGHCINSYFPSKERIPGWKQDGWSAVVIIEAGRAFDFLAWYRPLILPSAVSQKPELAQLFSVSPWVLRRPGPLSAPHFKKMELAKIGTLKVDVSKVERVFPDRRSAIYQVVNDISLVNELSTQPYSSLRAYSTLPRLAEILS
jgi:hypothetical protein